MGKRSNFERIEKDFYRTPFEAVKPLIPHLQYIKTYVEPCAGDGALIEHLKKYDKVCINAYDIEPKAKDIIQRDALTLNKCEGYCFVSNPPWTRKILHPLIEHLSIIAPTWLLFDYDWSCTAQAIPYLDYCMKIVAIGRVKWIPDSPYVGKDNAAWYLFSAAHQGGPKFFPKQA